VRHEIGFCPQHNILWDNLTCREHLRFFATLKGTASLNMQDVGAPAALQPADGGSEHSVDASKPDAAAQLEKDIEAILAEVDLIEKADTYAGNLSGGQKRKLSVALAFVGGSRFIVLDECTAGMDVAARRHTWGLIKRMSAGRTVLLTTHFMDEADLLGNTIAIMSKGKLRCAGNPSFLKSRLGVGYSLTLALDLERPDPDAVVALVRKHIPHLELLASSMSEVSLRLPMVDVPKFPELFDAIDGGRKAGTLGVRGYGISVTTLEEIFLRIGVEEEESDAVGGKVASPVAVATVPAEEIKVKSCDADGGTEEGSPVVEVDPSEMTPPYGEDKEGSAARPPELDNAHLSVQPQQSTEVFVSPSMLAAKRRQEACERMTWGARDVEELSASRREGHGAIKSKYQATMHGQLYTLLLKRAKYARRDMRTIVLQIVMPIVCISLAMLIALVEFPNAVPLTLRADAYPTAEFVYGGCPAGFEAFPDPGSVLVPAVPNTTNAFNTSEFLMRTYHTHTTERIVGVHCYDSRIVEKIEVPMLPLPIVIPTPASVLFVNESARHGAPMALAEFHGTWARLKRNNATPDWRLTSFPLPFNERESLQADAVITLLIGMFILIPFTFIPSTFVSFIVKEREVKAKHLQVISGMNFFIYWLSNFIFDITSFFITSLLVMAIFGMFGREEYVGSAELFFCMLVLFMLYGFAGVAGSYFVSFAFDSHSTAQNIVMLGNFIAGFLLVLVVYIMSFIDSTAEAAKVMRYIFRIIPSYALGEGILNVAALLLIKSVYGLEPSPFTKDIAGWPMIYLGISAVLFSTLTLLIDHPSRRMRQHHLTHSDEPAPPIEDEDADVAAERQAIESGERDATDVVIVRGLNKVWPIPTEPFQKVAVRNLSMGVHPHEVFAFLGTNGAGKTTAISILCGEFMPTRGKGSVLGNDVVDEAADARAHIGYCPQFDALHDLLTPIEHLMLYAGLRGMPDDRAMEAADILMEACDLTPHKNKIAQSLSGGNKRKLSLALSLIGQPAVCFLDEPSAGMDPKARRAMWDVIEHLSKHCSVVLTTHHLEEVEVLAHRAAIMVDGALKCVGSLQHLKNRFGSGFELVVRVHDTDHVEPVKAALAEKLPTATLKETRNLRFTYALPQEVALSDTFRAVEAAKALGIDDYALAQSSIEQVFLRISADANAHDECLASPTFGP